MPKAEAVPGLTNLDCNADGVCQMNFDSEFERRSRIVRLITRERLSRYLAMSNGQEAAAMHLYEVNTRLSEALYLPLQGLEVCLRNALAHELGKTFGDAWYNNFHGSFGNEAQAMLDAAMKSAKKIKGSAGSGRIIAELNFGFWVTILGSRYDDPLWRKVTRHAFPDRPRGVERRDIHQNLDRLRRLRNRVAHHEPIIHLDLARDHAAILQAIGWICPVTAQWVAASSRFETVLQETAFVPPTAS